MTKSSNKIAIMNDDSPIIGYDTVLSDVIDLLESARRASARTINTIITATYWKIGRRIVESEQVGAKRAEYGKKLLKKLSVNLKARFGRGFSERNLELMRLFYVGWPISQTLSAKSNDAIVGPVTTLLSPGAKPQSFVRQPILLHKIMSMYEYCNSATIIKGFSY
jgi:hypothetical protein